MSSTIDNTLPPSNVSLPRISVVIPVLNEEKNLPYVLPRIPAWVHEVIVVDGNSTDDTVAVAKRLNNKVQVITQKGKGKGNALRLGFEVAEGDIIVMLDADGSTNPREIPMFIVPLLNGWHFSKGSRFIQGGGSADLSRYRSLGNKGLMFITKLLFGSNYSDLCYGYNAFWRWTLDFILPDVDGFEIETLMNIRAIRANLRIAEVPSYEAARIHGSSNLHAIRDGLGILRIIFNERLRGRAIPVMAESLLVPSAIDTI